MYDAKCVRLILMFVTDSKPVSLKILYRTQKLEIGGKGDLPYKINGVNERLQNAKGDLPS